MCNRLPEINKNGDAGIFPVYYSLRVSPDGAIKLLYCTVLDFNYEPNPVMMVILV